MLGEVIEITKDIECLLQQKKLEWIKLNIKNKK